VTVDRLCLAPSILTADFGRLADEIKAVEPFVDRWHLDVMDGHYVPNLTFGPSTVEAIRSVTELPLHVHLMISEPERYSKMFVEAGADIISFHPEVVEDTGEVIGGIKSLGAEAGIAVHPDIDLEELERHLPTLSVALIMTVRPGFGGQAFLTEVLSKLEATRKLVDERGSSVDIEVDGGVKLSNLEETVRTGVDIVVAGSAIYDGIDAPAAAQRFREALDSLHRQRDRERSGRARPDAGNRT
jgi:ribulose-phosphate 3-epimerase